METKMQPKDFNTDLGETLPPVLADSNQLLHVFLHLAGQIGVRAHPESISGLRIQTQQDGSWVSITFTSEPSATEIPYQPLEALERGETRPTLSLGACSRIVAEHGGHILVLPASEGYKAFRVELPIAVKPVGQPHVANAPQRAVAGS